MRGRDDAGAGRTMRLVMDARARRLLRRLPVVNVYSLAELVLLALIAIQAARLVWAVLTPVSPLGDWRPVEAGVPGSPGDVLAGSDPFFRLSGAGAPAQVTTLQLTLFGTRLDEAMGRGSAIIAGPDGMQKAFVVGEEIIPGVRLKAVAFDHVTVDRGGAEEDLFLDQSGRVTPAQPAGGSPPAAPAPIGVPVPPAAGPPSAPAGMAVAGQIRQEIGFIPRIDGGRISGLVVRSQGSGNLFRRAGLREGDVVTAIAGRPVQSPADIERVAADFGHGGNIPITVERGSQTLPLAITIQATQ